MTKIRENFDKYFQEFLKFFIFSFYLKIIRKYIEIFNFSKL